jgi:hypothetical protein
MRDDERRMKGKLLSVRRSSSRIHRFLLPLAFSAARL